jgi:hypothetical protein
MLEVISFLTKACIYALAIKALSGLRFPWETCQCCGRKIRDHNGKY